MNNPTKEQLADQAWWDANAPEGAEYAKIFVDDEGVTVEFYRISHDDDYEYFDIDGNEWILSDGSACMLKASAIALPDKQWRGPEDGLPPAGTVCEVSNCGNPFEICTIRYMGSELCVVDHTMPHLDQHYHLSSVKFRPIRTPEQIAAEERYRVIDDMLKDEMLVVSGVSPNRSVCEAWHDAGYRKCSE